MALSDQLAALRGRRDGTKAPEPRETRRERVTPLQYLREIREELGKVSWPKRQEVVQGTVRVILVSLLFAALLGTVDFGAQRGLDKLLARVPAAQAPAAVPTAPTTTSEPITLPEGIPPPPGLEDQAQ